MTAPLPLHQLPLEPIVPASAPSLRRGGILFSVAGLLMFCPLAFGAVDSWSIFILQAGTAILFVIWALGQSRSARISIHWSPLFPPMIAFAGLMCIQLLPGVSAYWHATSSQLLLYVSYGFLCFLAVQVNLSSCAVATLGRALADSGVDVAV